MPGARERTKPKQVSTRGKTCSVCGRYMAVAPFTDGEVTTVHLPSGKHTYRLRSSR